MLAYLEGRLLEITENGCVLLTGGGVGYEVFLPSHVMSRLPEKGGQLCLYVSLVVREDAQELFGFASWDERQTFLTLIGINRVGARTALAMLSMYRPDDLRRIVAEDDVMSLTRVPGIGKKTGQQLFLELKYKLKADGTPALLPPGMDRPGTAFRDALTGLINLGYEEDRASLVLKDVFASDPDLDVGGALRAALKTLAKG